MTPGVCSQGYSHVGTLEGGMLSHIFAPSFFCVKYPSFSKQFTGVGYFLEMSLSPHKHMTHVFFIFIPFQESIRDDRFISQATYVFGNTLTLGVGELSLHSKAAEICRNADFNFLKSWL